MQAALAVPNLPLACSKLDDFKNQLATLIDYDPPVPVAQLIADANAIKTAIPSPP